MNDDLFDEMFYRATMIPTEWVMCQDCFGTGECLHCDGEGEIDGERCVVCSGDVNCFACDGEGRIKK